MVQITPFKGFLYNQEKSGSLADVTAPPYDVIKPDMQNALYSKNPQNVVRLILGKQYPEDDENNNRYTRSARDFKDWIDQGLLSEDAKLGYYGYSQSYEIEGDTISRMGFFARVKLEDFNAGNICPHEFTLAKAKKDRSQLIKACRANLSPVFGLFADPSKIIDQRLSEACSGPPIGVIEENGVTHKLWRIQDSETIAELSAAMQDKKVYIADGHHRYETALAYHQSQSPDDDSAHIMMFLTNVEAESMTVFAIHRVIRSPNSFIPKDFVSRLEPYFEMERFSGKPSAEAVRSKISYAGANRTALFAYLGRGEGYLLTLKDSKIVEPFLKENEPKELQVLDVIQLHALILRPVLGVDTLIPEHQQHVFYTINIDLGIQEVDAGKYHVAFFMNPTRISQVRELAEKGVRLPQKATYFYPKLLSGLVFNKFRS